MSIRRVVVGLDRYAWGRRAVTRCGYTSTNPLPEGFTVPAPHTVPGIGCIHGAAIAPESEVRAVEIIGSQGWSRDVMEGMVCRSRVPLSDRGVLTLDAIDPTDGTLVLYVADTPEDALELTPDPPQWHRSIAVNYLPSDSPTFILGVPNYGRRHHIQNTGNAAGNSEIILSATAFQDGGPSEDHTVTVDLLELLRTRPQHFGGGKVELSDWQPDDIFDGSWPITGGAPSGNTFQTQWRDDTGNLGIIALTVNGAQVPPGTDRCRIRMTVRI